MNVVVCQLRTQLTYITWIHNGVIFIQKEESFQLQKMFVNSLTYYDNLLLERYMLSFLIGDLGFVVIYEYIEVFM